MAHKQVYTFSKITQYLNENTSESKCVHVSVHAVCVNEITLLASSPAIIWVSIRISVSVGKRTDRALFELAIILFLCSSSDSEADEGHTQLTDSVNGTMLQSVFSQSSSMTDVEKSSNKSETKKEEDVPTVFN